MSSEKPINFTEPEPARDPFNVYPILFALPDGKAITLDCDVVAAAGKNYFIYDLYAFMEHLDKQFGGCLSIVHNFKNDTVTFYKRHMNF